MKKKKPLQNKEETIIIEKCPRLECEDNELKAIIDEDGFVIHFYCGKCSLNYHLEDLKTRKITKRFKNLGDYI